MTHASIQRTAVKRLIIRRSQVRGLPGPPKPAVQRAEPLVLPARWSFPPLEEPAGGEVVDLRPAAGRARRPPPPAAELAISSFGEVAARVAAAGEPRWLIEGLWPADAYGVLAAPGAGAELAAIQAELQAHPAALVVLDPLCLAAAGASGSSLYDMGAVLQAIQGVCQHAGRALVVVTHWNKTGDGRGADRISGAGPAAWARVICSVAVHYRGSDADGASGVLLGGRADWRGAGRHPLPHPPPGPRRRPGRPRRPPVLRGRGPGRRRRPGAGAGTRPPCPSPAGGSWSPCAPVGSSRRSSSSATGWLRPATRSSRAPSRPPSAS
jgi:AAA domain